MNAYVYQAALLCEDCAEKVKEKLRPARDLKGWQKDDSDEYPQGPYSDGGGEADSPQHCDHCRVFLENPLTSDGEEYVKERVEHRRINRNVAVPREWEDFYSYLFVE